ncbi:MAG: CZB domain-containing protein [Acidithiobacillus sp.]
MVSKVRNAVENGQHPDDTNDGRTCKFGDWLHGEGQALIGGMPEFQAVEPAHQKMHEQMADILGRLRRGVSIGDLIPALNDLEQDKKTVVSRLDTLCLALHIQHCGA